MAITLDSRSPFGRQQSGNSNWAKSFGRQQSGEINRANSFGRIHSGEIIRAKSSYRLRAPAGFTPLFRATQTSRSQASLCLQAVILFQHGFPIDASKTSPGPSLNSAHMAIHSVCGHSLRMWPFTPYVAIHSVCGHSLRMWPFTP